MYSDDSEEDYDENEFYHRKYRLLLEKCETIQQVNHLLMHYLVKIYHRNRVYQTIL